MVVLLFAISLLFMLMFLIYQGRIYREEVAVVEGIYFGMTPSEVEDSLGEPYEVREETPPVSGVNYLYQYFRIAFRGNEAVVTMRYIPIRNEFRLQFCKIECFDIADSDAFCSAVNDTLKYKLTGIDGVQQQVTSSGFSLYLNRGPVGTLYSISASEQIVTIVCECTEFYR